MKNVCGNGLSFIGMKTVHGSWHTLWQSDTYKLELLAFPIFPWIVTPLPSGFH